MLLFVIPKNQTEKRGGQDLQSFDHNTPNQTEALKTASDDIPNSEVKHKISKQKSNIGKHHEKANKNHPMKHQKTNVGKPEKIKLIMENQEKSIKKKSTINVLPSIPQILSTKPSFMHKPTVEEDSKNNNLDTKNNLNTLIASARQNTKDHINLIDLDHQQLNTD